MVEAGRGTLPDQRPEDARLDQHEVTEAAAAPLAAPDRRQRPLVEGSELRGLLGTECIRLVHHVDSRHRPTAREPLGDVGEHPRVARLDADSARAGRIGEEVAPGGADRRVDLARVEEAPRLVLVERRPGGCTVPAERGLVAGRAGLVEPPGQRRSPGVLVEVDDRVNALAFEAADPLRNPVEVTLVVIARRRLDPRPGNDQPDHVPADSRDPSWILPFERQDGLHVRALPVLAERVDVDAAQNHLATARVDDPAAVDRIGLRAQARQRRGAGRQCRDQRDGDRECLDAPPHRPERSGAIAPSRWSFGEPRVRPCIRSRSRSSGWRRPGCRRRRGS